MRSISTLTGACGGPGFHLKSAGQSVSDGKEPHQCGACGIRSGHGWNAQMRPQRWKRSTKGSLPGPRARKGHHQPRNRRANRGCCALPPRCAHQRSRKNSDCCCSKLETRSGITICLCHQLLYLLDQRKVVLVAVVVGNFVDEVAGGEQTVEGYSFLIARGQKLVIAVGLDNCTEAAHRCSHHWPGRAHIMLGELLHKHF